MCVLTYAFAGGSLGLVAHSSSVLPPLDVLHAGAGALGCFAVLIRAVHLCRPETTSAAWFAANVGVGTLALLWHL